MSSGRRLTFRQEFGDEGIDKKIGASARLYREKKPGNGTHAQLEKLLGDFRNFKDAVSTFGSLYHAKRLK
jgi:hypothetical protein